MKSNSATIIVKTKDGNEISDLVYPECPSCIVSSVPNDENFSCPISNDKRRKGYRETNQASIFLCKKTKKITVFRQELDATLQCIPNLDQIKKGIQKKEQDKVNRLIHNLTTLNAQSLQAMYSVLPQQEMAKNWYKQREVINESILKNTDKASQIILDISKLNLHMKSEIAVYRKIDRSDVVDPEFRTFKIRNVVLNVLHTFFPSFTRKDVYVKVEDSNALVKIDYELTQVAFYHLFENASKYILNNSSANIYFSENDGVLTMHFNMISIHVDQEERNSLCKEGFSGRQSKHLGLAGDGVGMWRIQQMMELNKGKFNFDFGTETENHRGILYSANEFRLMFRLIKT